MLKCQISKQQHIEINKERSEQLKYEIAQEFQTKQQEDE